MQIEGGIAQQRWTAIRIGGTILVAFCAAMIITAVIRPSMAGDIMHAVMNML